MLETIKQLTDSGAHFVLTGGAGRNIKQPTAARWQSHAPSAEAVAEQIKRIELGEPVGIGIMPNSIGAIFVDIDNGNANDIAKIAEPIAQLKTKRGAHLAYKKPHAKTVYKFDLHNCTGEVLNGNRYALLHTRPVAQAIEIIAEINQQAKHSGERIGTMPPELLAMNAARSAYNAARETQTQSQTESERIDNTRASACGYVVAEGIKIRYADLRRDDLPAIKIGYRNDAIWAMLWRSARRNYQCGKWHTRNQCEQHAHELNAMLQTPIDKTEIAHSARSAWHWRKCRKVNSETQSERGKMSGRSRRENIREKIATAVAMRNAGNSANEIANAVGKSARTVRRWTNIETADKSPQRRRQTTDAATQKKVLQMSANGKTTRHIGGAVGIHHATAARIILRARIDAQNATTATKIGAAMPTYHPPKAATNGAISAHKNGEKNADKKGQIVGLSQVDTNLAVNKAGGSETEAQNEKRQGKKNCKIEKMVIEPSAIGIDTPKPRTRHSRKQRQKIGKNFCAKNACGVNPNDL